MRAAPKDAGNFGDCSGSTGGDGLRDQIQRFIEVGASKFVPVLVGEPDD